MEFVSDHGLPGSVEPADLWEEPFVKDESAKDHGESSENDNFTRIIAVLQKGTELLVHEVRVGNQLLLKELKDGLVHEVRVGNQLLLKELKEGQIVEALQKHQEKIELTWKSSCEDVLKKTRAMVEFVDRATRVQEYEMTMKLATLVPESHVVVTSYVLQEVGEKGKPLGDIDGMVAGRVDNQDVVIFLEAKSHIKTVGEARKAMNQVRAIKTYWQQLIAGYPVDFSATHGDVHQYKAYCDLQVELYGGRKIRYAFGSFMFSDAVKTFFKLQKAMCITGDWEQKLTSLDLDDIA